MENINGLKVSESVLIVYETIYTILLEENYIIVEVMIVVIIFDKMIFFLKKI